MSDGVVVVSGDLMDRSKLAAAYPSATVLRTVREIDTGGVGLAVVDLRLVEPADITSLVERGVRVVAFGSHVDEAALAGATEAGAEALPRSVFFRRLAEGQYPNPG